MEHFGSFERSIFNLSAGGGLIIPCSLKDSLPRVVVVPVVLLVNFLGNTFISFVCADFDVGIGVGIFADCNAAATRWMSIILLILFIKIASFTAWPCSFSRFDKSRSFLKRICCSAFKLKCAVSHHAKISSALAGTTSVELFSTSFAPHL